MQVKDVPVGVLEKTIQLSDLRESTWCMFIHHARGSCAWNHTKSWNVPGAWSANHEKQKVFTYKNNVFFFKKSGF